MWFLKCTELWSTDCFIFLNGAINIFCIYSQVKPIIKAFNTVIYVCYSGSIS